MGENEKNMISIGAIYMQKTEEKFWGWFLFQSHIIPKPTCSEKKKKWGEEEAFSSNYTHPQNLIVFWRSLKYGSSHFAYSPKESDSSVFYLCSPSRVHSTPNPNSICSSNEFKQYHPYSVIQPVTWKLKLKKDYILLMG